MSNLNVSNFVMSGLDIGSARKTTNRDEVVKEESETTQSDF